jgi:hypothetical protein
VTRRHCCNVWQQYCTLPAYTSVTQWIFVIRTLLWGPPSGINIGMRIHVDPINVIHALRPVQDEHARTSGGV